MRFGVILFFALGLTALGGCKLLESGDADPDAALAPAPVLGPEIPVVLFQPEPGLTARERMRKSLDLLQVGQEGQAKAELNAYVLEVPDSRLARSLLTQIDADPIEMLGREHFLYIVRPGDSISSISKKMLGDPMKFHILARYNALDNPSEIKAGQTIRVPGKRQASRTASSKKESPASEARAPVAKKKPAIVKKTPAEPSAQAAGPAKAQIPAEIPAETPKVAAEALAVKAEAGKAAEPQAVALGSTPDAPMPNKTPDKAAPEATPGATPDATDAPSANDQMARLSPADSAVAEELKAVTIKRAILKAKGYSDRNDHSSALNHLEEGLLEYPDAAELQSAAIASYIRLSDQQAAAGQLGDAEKSLRRASEIAPNDPQVGDLLAVLERRQQVENLFQEASQLQGQGKTVEAFEIYKRITVLEPEHAAANKQVAKLKPAVTETYHRQGMIALRQQDLDTAISKLGKALEVDPDYTPARLERDRAIDLKKKIESLPNN